MDDLCVRPSHCFLPPSLLRQTAGADGCPLRQTPGCVWHPAGNSGWALREPQLHQLSATGQEGMRGIHLFFPHCLQHFPFFRNNPVTRISYFSPFSRPCNACCVLPPSWPPVWLEDAAVEVMRSCSRYRSEINVSDLLQQPDSSCEEYLHSIGEFPLQCTVRLCLDLVRAIRSDQSTAWMWNAFDHQFWFVLLYILLNYHSDWV